MNETFKSGEVIRITDEQVIEALKTRDTDPASKELFERWLDQLQAEVDRVYEEKGSVAGTIEAIRVSIERANVYYKAGFVREAIDDLTETRDAAGSGLFNGTGLEEEVDRSINTLIKLMGGKS